MVKFDIDVQDGTIDIPTMKLENGRIVTDHVNTYPTKDFIVSSDDVLTLESGEEVAKEIYDDVMSLFSDIEHVRVRVYANKQYFKFSVGKDFQISDIQRCFKREINSLKTTKMIEDILSSKNPKR